MKLIPNWKETLRYALSIRMFIIAAVFSGIEVLVPYLPSFIPISRSWMAIMTVVTCMLGLLTRLIAQNSISGDKNGNQA